MNYAKGLLNTGKSSLPRSSICWVRDWLHNDFTERSTC